MYHLEGLSIGEISRKTGIHRDTISKYLSADITEPPCYKLSTARKHPVLDDFIPIIDEILNSDQKRHRKKRHTIKRICERLQDEDGYTGGYSTMTD